MKKEPRKTKQWATEAFDALKLAYSLFQRDFPEPSEADKMIFIGYATPIAAMNRGIEDKQKIAVANEYVLENLRIDVGAKNEDEPVYHSICFLIAYIDSHVSFGTFSEKKGEAIMDYLSKNFQITNPL